LEVDGDVEATQVDAAVKPAELAHDLAGARGPPDEAPPPPRVHGDDLVEVGMVTEDGVLAGLDDPGDAGVRPGPAQRARYGEGGDPVAQRGQLTARAVPRRPPKRSRMTRIKSRAP